MADARQRAIRARKGQAYKSGNAVEMADAERELIENQAELRDLRRVATPVPNQQVPQINANRRYLAEQAKAHLSSQIAQDRAYGTSDVGDTSLAAGQALQAKAGIRPQTEAMSPTSAAMIRNMQRLSATRPYLPDSGGPYSTPSLDLRQQEMAKRAMAMREADEAEKRLATVDEKFRPLGQEMKYGEYLDPETQALKDRQYAASMAQQEAMARQSQRYASRNESLGRKGDDPISELSVGAVRSQQEQDAARNAQMATLKAQQAEAERMAEGGGKARTLEEMRAEYEMAKLGPEIAEAKRQASVASEAPANAAAKLAAAEAMALANSGGDLGSKVAELEKMAPLLEPAQLADIRTRLLTHPEIAQLEADNMEPGLREQAGVGFGSVMQGIQGGPGMLNPFVERARLRQANRNNILQLIERIRRLGAADVAAVAQGAPAQ